MKPPRAPLPRLLLLASAVLAMHLLLLNVARQGGRVAPSGPAPAFITRSVPVMPQAVPPPLDQPLRAARVNGEPAGVPRAAQQAGDRPEPSPMAVVPAAAPEQSTLAKAPVAPAALAYALPPSLRLQFTVRAGARGELREGRSELAWRHDGESYEASLDIGGGSLPARRQRSTGRITVEGLAPGRFSDRIRSEEAAHFEPDQGKVIFSSNRPEAALQPGAQDRLSVLVQLGAMIAGDPARYPAGTAIQVQVAGTRDAAPGLFVVQGEEELVLPGGVVKALKLTRGPRADYDQTVELWLAPTLDYVPVRLRLTQPNGDWADHQWSSTDRD